MWCQWHAPGDQLAGGGGGEGEGHALRSTPQRGGHASAARQHFRWAGTTTRSHTGRHRATMRCNARNRRVQARQGQEWGRGGCRQFTVNKDGIVCVGINQSRGTPSAAAFARCLQLSSACLQVVALAPPVAEPWVSRMWHGSQPRHAQVSSSVPRWCHMQRWAIAEGVCRQSLGILDWKAPRRAVGSVRRGNAGLLYAPPAVFGACTLHVGERPNVGARL